MILFKSSMMLFLSKTSISAIFMGFEGKTRSSMLMFSSNFIFSIIAKLESKSIFYLFFTLLIKDFSIEGAFVPGLLLCSKNLEQSKSPGTTAPSIEKSLLLMTYKFFIGVIKYFMIHKDSFSTMITLTLFSVFYFIVEMV